MPNSHHSLTHSPLQNQDLFHSSAKQGTSKKNNKIVSLKLIHPFIGINIRGGKKKNNTSDSDVVTKPTSSLDTSIFDNESNIQRCNNRLLNSISKSTTNKNIDDEVLKTIEVGSLLEFNMVGKEDMVRQTIGDNIVQS
ncbi:hypothetical protein Tco_0054200 [Tanacetum coccineum]